MVGKKVVCINSKGLPKLMPMSVASKLVEGEIYTIEKLLFHEMQQEYGFVLEEIDMSNSMPFNSFNAKRFREATSLEIAESAEADEVVKELISEVLETEMV